jgi:hypothetical protein
MLRTDIHHQSEYALFSKFENLDLKSVIFKLTHPKDVHQWSLEKAEHVVSQYKKFLFLNALYPEQELIPTREIDDVWHVHILDTEKYRNDCQYLFGHFLDHYPYSGLKGKQNEEEHLKKFEFSQNLFRKIFPSEDTNNDSKTSKTLAHSSSILSASFSSDKPAYSSSHPK